MKSAEVARGTQRQFWGTALALDSRYDGTNIEGQGVNVKWKMMECWMRRWQCEVDHTGHNRASSFEIGSSILKIPYALSISNVEYPTPNVEVGGYVRGVIRG